MTSQPVHPLSGTNNNKSLDHDWRLKEHFGSIYLLSGSKERLPRVIEELASVGLHKGDYTIFPGTDANQLPDWMVERMYEKGEEKRDKNELEAIHKGQTGCFISHFRLIECAQEKYRKAIKALEQATQSNISECKEELRKRSSILVFEDNVGFGYLNKNRIQRKSIGHHLAKTMAELPENWDFFYLMGWDFGKPRLVQPRIIKLEYGVIIKAYAIKHTTFAALKKELSVINDKTVHRISPVDHHIAKLHKIFNAYMIHPPCCYRLPGSSMVGRENVELPYQPQHKFG